MKKLIYPAAISWALSLIATPSYANQATFKDGLSYIGCEADILINDGSAVRDRNSVSQVKFESELKTPLERKTYKESVNSKLDATISLRPVSYSRDQNTGAISNITYRASIVLLTKAGKIAGSLSTALTPFDSVVFNKFGSVSLFENTMNRDYLNILTDEYRQFEGDFSQSTTLLQTILKESNEAGTFKYGDWISISLNCIGTNDKLD